jgi:opacity protein-like surface antigen
MAVGTAYDWSGVYLGGHVGFGWMPSTDRIDPANASAVDAFATGFVRDAGIATSVPLDSKGAMGGGQIGYNWQFSPNWVSGIEADISATDFKATNSLLNTRDFTRPMTAHQQLNCLAQFGAGWVSRREIDSWFMGPAVLHMAMATYRLLFQEPPAVLLPSIVSRALRPA